MRNVSIYSVQAESLPSKSGVFLKTWKRVIITIDPAAENIEKGTRELIHENESHEAWPVCRTT